MNTTDPDQGRRQTFRIPFWVGTCVFLAIVVFFLWQEHRAHLFGAIPYLLLLACPLMHLFMHHGHGSHSRGHGTHPHAPEDKMP